jgi:PKD repeat protein
MLYTGPLNITKEGTTGIFYRSVDNASMVESTKMAVISIDKTPPTLTYVLTPAPNSNGWTSQDVHLHYEAGDDVSELESRPHDMTLTNEGVYSTLAGTATDKAGNSVTVAVPEFGIDRTPPRVGNLTVQGNAYVGDYLPVSASVVEENPQRIEWDFGDGMGTSGTPSNNVVRGLHAYKQPGSYRITLNVVDKAGNAVSSTATVTIYGTIPTALPTATPVPTPEVTPVPTPVPLPSATPKPAPSPGFILISLALIGGALLVARMGKK